MPPRATLPARAILARFHNSEEAPIWASYIHRQLHGVATPPAGEDGRGCSFPRASPFAFGTAASQVPKTPDLLRDSSGSSGSCGHPQALSDLSLSSIPLSSQESADFGCNAATIQGRVWELAREPMGSRNVQRILDAVDPDMYDELALELKGHVLEAMLDPHANYVLHKCITRSAPNALQVITEDFLNQTREGIIQAARHRYGCRIIERLVEVADADAVAQLCETLLHDAVPLSEHAYGNYTMQHLLMHGPVAHRSQLLSILIDHAAELGANFHGSAVIREALIQGSREEATALARALVRSPGLLAQMTRTKHGHSAVKYVLEALDASEQETARKQFCAEAAKPRAVRRKHKSH